MSDKKQVRADFRNNTFSRDGYKCVVCGKKATPQNATEILDAHHIVNRNDIPGGGYVTENGITLCKGVDGSSCHEKAEAYLSGESDDVNFSPDKLYELIGSSKEEAFCAAAELLWENHLKNCVNCKKAIRNKNKESRLENCCEIGKPLYLSFIEANDAAGY